MDFLSFLMRLRLPAALWLLATMFDVSGACAETLTEAKVKSAFLYNFAKFIVWPADSLSSPRQPFTFCTLGDNALSGTLDETLQGKTIDGHPLMSRHLKNASAVNGCQVLFVPASKSSDGGTFSANLLPRGLLTVTEDENHELPKEGAMITFVLSSNRVRFIIDAKSAEKAGLNISSKLLNLALAVNK